LSLAFRDAEAADIASALALIESGYRGDSARRGWTHEADLLGGQRTDAQALAEIVADPKQKLVLAEQDGELVGCVLIADKGVRGAARVGYLGLLTVSPLLQSGGLGSALVVEAERRAAMFGASVMEMTVIKQRSELIAWYRRRGYALSGREEPFPLDDPRFGLPARRDLVFVVLTKSIAT
jgi:predicted N-acetyltransferase YhbS